MITRVYIVRKEQKTSPVCTATGMDTSLNNVTERRSTGKNAHTVTHRVVKESSSQINKNTTKKKKEKMLMSLKKNLTPISHLAMMQ